MLPLAGAGVSAPAREFADSCAATRASRTADIETLPTPENVPASKFVRFPALVIWRENRLSTGRLYSARKTPAQSSSETDVALENRLPFRRDSQRPRVFVFKCLLRNCSSLTCHDPIHLNRYIATVGYVNMRASNVIHSTLQTCKRPGLPAHES